MQQCNSTKGENDEESSYGTVESDKLSDWQYLTATFDNNQMLTSGAELDQLRDDSATLVLDVKPADVRLKRYPSNSIINDVSDEANKRSRGMKTNPSSDSQLLHDVHIDQHNLYTIHTPKESLKEHIHSNELRVKPCSYPQHQSQALSQSGSGLPQEPMLNHMNQSHSFSNFPSPSLSLSNKPERHPSIRGIGNNESNHGQDQNGLFQAIQATNLFLNTIHHEQTLLDEYMFPQSLTQSVYIDVARPQTQLEMVPRDLHHSGVYEGNHLHADHSAIRNIYAAATAPYYPTPRDSLSMERAGVIRDMGGDAFCSGTGVDNGVENKLHSNLPSCLEMGVGTLENSAVPRTSREQVHFDNAMMEEQMSIWMSMIGTTPLIPPHLQFSNKKLLLHPLTPYNYYYRDERDNIVAHISDESDPLPPAVSNFTLTNMQALLHQHWFIDPLKKKRKHRISHGKMNFQKLSKVIAQRWHELPFEGRNFYRSVARYDDLYYHQQLDIIKQRSDPS
jgi:hypothetical protein